MLAQGDGVAYGLRSASLADLSKPSDASAIVGYGGIVGNFVEGESLTGVLSWTDPDARTRPGALILRPHASRGYLRDVVVARDIAGVQAALYAADGAATGQLTFTVALPSGAPAPGARVSVTDAAGTMVTLAVADASGRGEARLPPGEYRLSAAMPGRLIGAAQPATVTAGGSAQVALALPEARALSVSVKDPAGVASPAKVTVWCAGGPCPFGPELYRQHLLLETPPAQAAAVGFVPVTGELSLTLPPGEYDLVVSRGPEFNTWPDTWPASPRHVDLRQADARVEAVLGRVVDSSGWISADLHVHAAASADSSVANELRAAGFLAEGVDVLVSTDHEYVTDFAPAVRALGAEPLMATMVGEELTTVSHGHFNAFPLVRQDLATGGAFDHAGGEDAPTYRLGDLFPAVKAAHPGAVVQINHPRGMLGALTLLKVDTATLASHGDPANYNMAPAPDATADDTRLFGDGFDAMESANGPSPSFAVLNDWMTFLSRGTVRATTGVSDSHKVTADSGGYSRTWVRVADDAPAHFQPALFAEGLRRRQAFVSNGPFLHVTARRLDAAGQPVGEAVEVGGTLSVGVTESVELALDAQGPEWMQLDRAELYSHAPGREAVNGESNSSWPDGRILDRKPLDLATAVEAVPGTTLRRTHYRERFVVKPARDTWYVVMVRGFGRSMAPLHGATPVAYSNAILVDADGSGAYDDFPLKPGQPLRAAPRPVVHRPPTEAELRQALARLLSHTHE